MKIEIGDRGFMDDGTFCEVVKFLEMSMEVQEVNMSTGKVYEPRYSVTSLTLLTGDHILARMNPTLMDSQPSVQLTAEKGAEMIYHALGEPLDRLTGGEHYLQVEGATVTFQVGGQEWEVVVKPPRCSECDLHNGRHHPSCNSKAS